MAEGMEGHNMTPIDGGDDNGAQDSSFEKNNHTQPESGGAAGPHRGAEDSEAGGAGREEEDETGRQDEGAAPELDDEGNPIEGEFVEEGEGSQPPITADAIKQMITEAMKAAQPPAEEKPVQLSEEQWAAKEAEVGASRQAIQFFTGQAIKIHNILMDKMEERFARIEKGENLRSLARTKGFEDAQRYPKYVDEFLKQFPAKFHANPQILKTAVIYARGMASKGNINRARTEQERHRRIAGAARPASPGGATAGARRPVSGGKQPPLRPDQKQVMEKFGMPESEYRSLQGSRGRAVVTTRPGR